MRIFLIVTMGIFLSLPAWAQDENVPAPPTPPGAGKIINDDDVPPAIAAKPSLNDLRDQQIESDDEKAAAHENAPSQDADADPDACTAKDISATMDIPSNMREMDTSGGSPAGSKGTVVQPRGYVMGTIDSKEARASKMSACKAAYSKMTNDCDKGMSCDGCEAALKQFSTVCGYVGKSQSIEGQAPGTGGNGGGLTLDGRRNVPVNKIPKM